MCERCYNTYMLLGEMDKEALEETWGVDENIKQAKKKIRRDKAISVRAPPPPLPMPLTYEYSNWPFNLTLPHRPSKRRGRRSSNPSAPSRKSSRPSPTATTSSAPSPLREGEGWLRRRDVDLSLCPRSDPAALWRVARARLCWTSGLMRGGVDLRRFKSFGSFASASMAKLPVVKER